MIMNRDLPTPYSSLYTATLIGEQIYEYYLQLCKKGLYDFRYTGVMTDSDIPSDQVRL